MSFDPYFLVAQIRAELAHIQRHWSQLGRPTITLLLTGTMLETDDPESEDAMPFLTLIEEFRSGNCNGVRVKLGRLNQLSLTATVERMDFLHDFEFYQSPVRNALPECFYLAFNSERSGPLSSIQEFKLESETSISRLIKDLRDSENLYEQVELLSTLVRLKGLTFDTGLGQPEQTVTVAQLLNEIYFKAGKLKWWAIVRRVAGLYDKMALNLADVVTDILVRQNKLRSVSPTAKFP